MFAIVPALLACLLAAGAFAQDRDSRAEVEITYPAPRAEVGEPMVLTFDISNASRVEDPRVPDTPGLRAQVNRSREASQTTIVNGRATHRTTVRFDVLFLADQPGRFEIPRVRIVVDGQTYESRETAVEVSGFDVGSMARAELDVEPKEVLVGQNATATLRIWIRNPRAGRIAPDPARLWASTVLPNDSKWGLFQNALKELYDEGRFRVAPRTERIGTDEWVIYELESTLSPDKPGPLEISGIEVRLRYPRSVAGGERLLTLEPTQPEVVVQSPPSQDKPANYTGAVGVFEIDARAKPTRVSVGDPITLSVIIVDRTRGGADLARLLPPPVSEQADLQRSFRMPSEPLIGTVNGRTKVFTQTLRPNSERVTEIPPILFSFFDPETRSYRTVQSKPIAITVMPVERIDTVAVTGGSAVPSRPSSVPESKLTDVEGGLVASIRATPSMLASDRIEPGWGALAVVVLPPLFAGVAWVLRRRADRFGADEGLRRSRGASSRARRAIASAADAPAVAAALKQFLADRSGLAAASLTRREALALLDAAGADESLCHELDRILADGERAAFAPQREAPSESLRSNSRRLLPRLERLNLAPRPEVQR